MSLLISHNLQISLTSNIRLVSLTTNKSYCISTNFRRRYKMAQLLLDKNAYSMFLSCWQSWSSNIRELFLSLWFQEISFHSEPNVFFSQFTLNWNHEYILMHQLLWISKILQVEKSASNMEKNPVNQTRYFKLENCKNPVQIDRELGFLCESKTNIMIWTFFKSFRRASD